MRKRILIVLLTAVMATAMAGTAFAAGAEEDLLAKIQQKGSITIAMEGNWAPWTFEDKDGNLVFAQKPP